MSHLSPHATSDPGVSHALGLTSARLVPRRHLFTPQKCKKQLAGLAAESGTAKARTEVNSQGSVPADLASRWCQVMLGLISSWIL